MPWTGAKSTELSNCPDTSHCWSHCCRGKTLGLQIRLLPWSWRRYQVRRHQKGSPSSQWLPRWAEPFQNPPPPPQLPSPSSASKWSVLLCWSYWTIAKLWVSYNWPPLSTNSSLKTHDCCLWHRSNNKSFPAALWGIKPSYYITTFTQTVCNDHTIYRDSLKLLPLHVTLFFISSN